jgi:hypothetical protein
MKYWWACVGHGSCGLGWKLQGFVSGRWVEHFAHGLDTYVSVLHLPFVVGLGQYGADTLDHLHNECDRGFEFEAPTGGAHARPFPG